MMLELAVAVAVAVAVTVAVAVFSQYTKTNKTIIK